MLQKAKQSLKQGKLMDTIAYCRRSNFNDDDIAYLTISMIKDIDDGNKNYPIAMQYINDCINYKGD